MGTEIEIFISKDANFSEKKARKSAEKVFRLFRKFEKIFSRFDQNSELCRLNFAGEKKVSAEFWELLRLALKMAKKSDGIFNPLVSVASLGYFCDFSAQKFQKSSPKNLDFSKIKIDEKTRKVFLPKNSELDFGGCAKGFSVDRAVKILENDFENFVISAGGDGFARGAFHGKKWEIAIADPRDETKNVFFLELENAGFATSGNYRRKWEIDGEKFHHLADGKKNKNRFFAPKSTTVIAPSAVLADILATIAFFLEPRAADDFLVKFSATGFSF